MIPTRELAVAIIQVLTVRLSPGDQDLNTLWHCEILARNVAAKTRNGIETRFFVMLLTLFALSLPYIYLAKLCLIHFPWQAVLEQCSPLGWRSDSGSLD